MTLAVNRAETTFCNDSDMLDGTRHRSEEAMTPLLSRALRRARAGDRGALRFLYARYADDVYSYARTIVDDHDEAQDVTRRAFARLECLIDRYEEHDAPFSVWIRRVTRSVATENIHR